MQTAKYCNECGEALQAPRAGLGFLRMHCEKCAPRFRAWRFMKITNLVLLIIIAFGIGRYITPQRTVYLIGTPIEPIASEPSAGSANPTSPTTQESPASKPANEIMAICGAPTQSGKPCQRVVKGGGYCWQHRDKYGQKNKNASGQ